MKRKYILFYIIMIAAACAVMLFGINSGAMKINPKDTICVIAAKLTGGSAEGIADNVTAVVWNIRLPRLLCGMLVGCGLAAAGVIFQGILQNPLADPYTLGISTGASFGAALAIYINIVSGLYMPITLFALTASLVTLAAVIAISKRGSSFESSNLIIGGIIVSAVLSSGVSMLKLMSGENVGAIVFWIMGSLTASTWSDVYILAPVVISAVIIAGMIARRLDIMALGDQNAESLGINTSRTRLIFLVLGALITAVCVSTSGVIGFVGLVIPHLLRMRLTAKNRVLLYASCVTGAVLLTLADNVTRLMPSGEIPVGVLTTLIGGPFFIYVFLKKR
ncbi:MAG: iron ABC transporter permease [Oscillospiraceae bacterium]|nr:iron ABC transporter permease [Oscillospiraceae bacterium]